MTLSCESVCHLEFEPVHDVLDVRAGQRLPEAQLLSKVDLAVELMELLQELLLGDGTVQDGAAHTERLRATHLLPRDTLELLPPLTYQIMAPGTTSSSTS